MKATNSFNMKKETKRMLANCDTGRRSLVKNMMIAAQLAFEKAKRETAKQSRNNNSGDE
jgi:hypothetical protein